MNQTNTVIIGARTNTSHQWRRSRTGGTWRCCFCKIEPIKSSHKNNNLGAECPERVKCPNCGGCGSIFKNQMDQHLTPCNQCDGTGRWPGADRKKEQNEVHKALYGDNMKKRFPRLDPAQRARIHAAHNASQKHVHAVDSLTVRGTLTVDGFVQEFDWERASGVLGMTVAELKYQSVLRGDGSGGPDAILDKDDRPEPPDRCSHCRGVGVTTPSGRWEPGCERCQYCMGTGRRPLRTVSGRMSSKTPGRISGPMSWEDALAACDISPDPPREQYDPSKEEE